MNKAAKKRTTFLATLGDLNRPLRVRPVNVMGQDWWAVDAEDTWPGMVMDLRRLGFESMAWGEEVLVREGAQSVCSIVATTRLSVYHVYLMPGPYSLQWTGQSARWAIRPGQ